MAQPKHGASSVMNYTYSAVYIRIIIVELLHVCDEGRTQTWSDHKAVNPTATVRIALGRRLTAVQQGTMLTKLSIYQQQQLLHNAGRRLTMFTKQQEGAFYSVHHMRTHLV